MRKSNEYREYQRELKEDAQKEKLLLEKCGFIKTKENPIEDREEMNNEYNKSVQVYPCPIGTTVYEVCEDWSFARSSVGIQMWIEETKFEASMCDEVGKTIFLSYEKAERAIEGLNIK